MDEYKSIVNLPAGQAGPPAQDDAQIVNDQVPANAVVPEPVLPTPVVDAELPKPEQESNPAPEESTETVKFTPPPENLPAMSLVHAEVEKIKPNPWQPRRTFNEQALQELSDSIKIHGVLQPLVVVPLPDGDYQLVVGERRLRASKLAGLSTVPVIVRDYVEEQNKLELALIENIQRHNLDPVEEALAYKQLIDQYKMTQDEVARKVGKGRTTVTNMLRLLHLPLKIQAAMAEGKITEGHGRAILAIPGLEKQLALYEMVVGQAMTVRQIEDKVREMLDRPKLVKAPRVPTDPEVMALESELRGKLGTKVKVQKSGDTGKITIEFFSQEELNTFMDKVKRLEQ